MNSNANYWIWLSHCFPYGSIEPEAIRKIYGTAKRAYDSRKEWSRNYSARRRQRIESLHPDAFQQVMESYRKKQITVLCYEDESYPSRLKTTDSPPMVLYAMGDLSLLARRIVCVVGTRTPTEYAKEAAFRIAKDLAMRGIVVASGCAEGIDTAAHRGALETGKTISILGTSFDASYPVSNTGLKRTILEQGGLLLSEYPLGVKTNPVMFPIRNRLLSGISDAVVLVQAPARSGALITARHALEQGKEVFCLPPGNIFSSAYEGGKQLLRDGACPYLGVQDIEEMYRYHAYPDLQGVLEEYTQKKEEKSPGLSLSPIAQRVLDILDDSEDRSIEAISRALSKRVDQVMAALTELEMAGVVLRTGNRYIKG